MAITTPTSRVLVDSEFFALLNDGPGLYSCRVLAIVPDSYGDFWIIFEMAEDTDYQGVHAVGTGSVFFKGFEEAPL